MLFAVHLNKEHASSGRSVPTRHYIILLSSQPHVAAHEEPDDAVVQRVA